MGKAKTRIAADLGDEAALDIYKSLLKITRNVILRLTNVRRMLFYSDSIGTNDDWSAGDFEKYLQADGDLGQRMEAAFQAAFERSDQVVIVGSDCPEITEAIIETAFQSLADADVVIGPTFDGGYYLLGMKSLHKGLFEDIPWSTEEVFRRTIDKAKTLGMVVVEGPRLNDIDYAHDWQAYLERNG